MAKAKAKAKVKAPARTGKLSKPRDYGGDSRGRTFARTGSTYGKCEFCGFSRVYPLKAWSRHTRVTCSQCGGYVAPSGRAQQQNPALLTVDKNAPVARHCDRCNAKLNSYNPESLCWSCRSRPRV